MQGKLLSARRVPLHKTDSVGLSEQERQACTEVLKQRKGSSQQVRRAQIVLKAEADGPSWPDSRMAEACTGRVQTREN